MKILSRVTVSPGPCTLNGPATVMLATLRYVCTTSSRTRSMMPSLSSVSFRNVAASSRAGLHRHADLEMHRGVPPPSTIFLGLAAMVNSWSLRSSSLRSSLRSRSRPRYSSSTFRCRPKSRIRRPPGTRGARSSRRASRPARLRSNDRSESGHDERYRSDTPRGPWYRPPRSG